VAKGLLHDWKAGTDDTEVGLDQSPRPSRNEAVGDVGLVLDRTGDSSGAKDTGNGDTGSGVSIAPSDYLIWIWRLTIHPARRRQKASAFP
jgi:hypothetical protein